MYPHYYTLCFISCCPCHIILFHVIFISSHIVSCHFMSCHLVSYRVISSRIVSCHFMSCHIISCQIISYRIVSYIYIYLFISNLESRLHISHCVFVAQAWRGCGRTITNCTASGVKPPICSLAQWRVTWKFVDFFGGSIAMEYRNSWMFYFRENLPLKWMMTGGGLISGNLHLGRGGSHFTLVWFGCELMKVHESWMMLDLCHVLHWM